MIYIRRTSAFGDVLWSEPVVRFFLNKNKKVKIITDFPEVFANYPSNNLSYGKKLKNIDKALSLLKKKLGLKPYVIDLNKAYEKRPKIHVLKAYYEAAGINNEPLSYPKLHLTEQEKKNKFDRPYVVLHIDKNRVNYRNAYGIDWEKVVNYIKEKGFKVVQISGTGQAIYGNWIKTTTLRDAIPLIYNCSFFIGIDSGPSHIAASFNKPSIIFFGAVNPAYRHLGSFKGKFMQQPCEYAGCYHEVISGEGQVCKLVGSSGIPICSLHTTEAVIENVNSILVEL